MNVVVLDDEQKVCTLVCALILWEELGLKLAGTAFDGEKGLELIRKVNPDIVITDIRMPSLDGLQLIEQSKTYNPDLQFIIVSGYSQFDYAKKAIKFGVSDYLLKPLNQDELNDALRKLIKINNERKKTQGNLIDSASIRRHYLIDFINDHTNSEKLWDYFNCSENIAVSIINCDGEFYKYDQQAIEVIRNKIKDVFLNYLNFTEDWDLFFLEKFHGFLLVVSFKCKEQKNYANNLKHAFQEVVLNFSNIYPNLTITFSLGVPVKNVCKLHSEIKNVTNTALSRLYSGRGEFNEQTKLNFFVDFETSKNVSNKIKYLSIKDELDEAEIKKQMNLLINLDYSTFPLTIEAIINDLNSFYNEKLGDKASKINFIESYYANNTEQVINIVEQQIRKGFLLLRERSKNEAVKPIKEAKTYIENHYSNEQLSLEYLSEIVRLSPTYFSSLFKKETNIGFSEYVRKVRIEKAKELLASTSLPIKDIAPKVGYNNPKQFAKCFIKYVGIKPKDYRKLYG